MDAASRSSSAMPFSRMSPVGRRADAEGNTSYISTTSTAFPASKWAAAARNVPEPDSGHIGTISITARVCQTRRNAMKPRIQCVLTQWIPGFTASGSRPMRQRDG